MSNLVIPAAGAAIGFYVGGPTGALMGWSVGSSYQAGKADPEQPSLGDLRLQTSSYGAVIPIISGQQRLSGNIIWTTDKIPYETTEGGKGGGPEVTTTTYSVSMAIAICKGPILGITRIWEDGTLKMDVNGAQKKMPGTLFIGDDTQLPSTVIEATEGVGEVPAYRGLAYMVFDNFDLGPSGRVPMFSFEVVTAGAL